MRKPLFPSLFVSTTPSTGSQAVVVIKRIATATLAFVFMFSTDTLFTTRSTLVLADTITSNNQPSKHNKHNKQYSSSFLRPMDLPKTNTEWISLHERMEFLPSTTNQELDWNNFLPPPATFGTGRINQGKRRTNAINRGGTNPYTRQRRQQQQQQQQQQPPPPPPPPPPQTLSQHKRVLEENQNVDETNNDDATETNRYNNPQYRVQPFVEGVSDYDEYQQAWRLLGFMIDCDDNSGNNSNNNNNGSGSQDDNDTGLGCSRYVIWAAYVDLEYEGGGIGEYQYWDRDKQSWDTTTCQYTGSERCAKMDCHEENTHWSLLGFFKHKSYDDWMEQLFKHEAFCMWSDEEYNFMSNARKTWPQGCILSSTTTEEGSPIYYDLKPAQGGGITMALYTDERCVTEYESQGKNDPINVENVIGNILVEGGSGDRGDYNYDEQYTTLDSSLAAWDYSFDVFKICQPCVAHDLLNYGYSNNNMQGANYGKYTYGNGNGADDDYYQNYQYNGAADYDCYDDADYTNVNQCMKFMAKTEMYTATFRDITLATSQGTLVDKPLSGYRQAKENHSGIIGTYIFLIVSTVFFVYSVIKFRKIQKEMSYSWDPRQPLVFA